MVPSEFAASLRRMPAAAGAIRVPNVIPRRLLRLVPIPSQTSHNRNPERNALKYCRSSAIRASKTGPGIKGLVSWPNPPSARIYRRWLEWDHRDHYIESQPSHCCHLSYCAGLGFPQPDTPAMRIFRSPVNATSIFTAPLLFLGAAFTPPHMSLSTVFAICSAYFGVEIERGIIGTQYRQINFGPLQDVPDDWKCVDQAHPHRLIYLTFKTINIFVAYPFRQ